MNHRRLAVVLMALTTLSLPQCVTGGRESGEGQQSAPETSQSVWLDTNGNPTPETPWQRSSGSLGGLLFFTDDPDRLYAEWGREQEGVFLPETDSVARGSWVLGSVVFTGCQPDPDGLCQLVVRYRITTADGREIGPEVPCDLWLGKPAPPFGQLQLAAQGLQIQPEETDQGPFTVKAYILDRVNGTRLLLERELVIE